METLKNKQIAQMMSIWLLFTIGFLSLSLLFFVPPLAAQLSIEDGPVENATAFFLLIAAVSMASKGAMLLKRSHTQVAIAGMAIFIGILFFIFAGEEISWGQRLFGFASGEFLEEYNWQGELNFHNLQTDVFNIAFHYGALLFFVIAPLFRTRFLSVVKPLPGSSIIQYFIAPRWIALPAFIFLGMLDSRFLFMIEKPWAAVFYIAALGIGVAILLQQLFKARKSQHTADAVALSLSLLLIIFGIFISYVYAVDAQATNAISEYKEFFVAGCIVIYALFWKSALSDGVTSHQR